MYYVFLNYTDLLLLKRHSYSNSNNNVHVHVKINFNCYYSNNERCESVLILKKMPANELALLFENVPTF